ncbi:hypothetical protein ACWD4J_27675 [Streptomyces sp. NPDC002577]
MERGELRGLVEGRVLLTSRALEAGWPRRSLLRKLGAEGWTRIQASAWAEPGWDVDLPTRLRAAQLVVSHRSAAALWRIEVLGSGQRQAEMEFSDPGLAVRREGRGVRVYRVPLAPDEVVECRGLRVTTVNRTLGDLLRAGPRDDALVSVESALTRRTVGHVRRGPLTTLGAIATALQAPGASPRGAARARRRLELADPNAGSPAETIARLRMHDAGLRPESQAELLTPGGRRCFPDFLFRAEGLAVEIEGYAYHGTRESHRRDLARFNQILQCAEVRTLLRYTAMDVFHRPAHLIEEIRDALVRLRAGRAPSQSAAQNPMDASVAPWR